MASQLSGSPASGNGSPGSPGAGRSTRVVAKKQFKARVDMLIDAIQALQAMTRKTSTLQKNQQSVVDIQFQNGVVVRREFGESEVKELTNLIIEELKKLPAEAAGINKTRRVTAPNSGFLAPTMFNDEIVNFFARATLGPVVDGEFTGIPDKSGNWKITPNTSTLRAVENSRLNSVLYFTQAQINGQQNPLYRIIIPGILAPLFALHAYNSRMQLPNEARFLSASNEMRQMLRNTIMETIQNDAATLASKYPQLTQRIAEVRQNMLASIENPNVLYNNVVTGTDSIFNPNRFLYAHFSKIMSRGKVVIPQGQPQLPDILANVRSQIPNIYGNILHQSEPNEFQEFADAWRNSTAQGTPAAAEGPRYEELIFKNQQQSVSLARALKNFQQTAAQRRARTAARNAAKQQAAAAGATQGGLANVGGLPGVGGVGGLPNIGGLPNVSGFPNVGGLPGL